MAKIAELKGPPGGRIFWPPGIVTSRLLKKRESHLTSEGPDRALWQKSGPPLREGREVKGQLIEAVVNPNCPERETSTAVHSLRRDLLCLLGRPPSLVARILQPETVDSGSLKETTDEDPWELTFESPTSGSKVKSLFPSSRREKAAGKELKNQTAKKVTKAGLLGLASEKTTAPPTRALPESTAGAAGQAPAEVCPPSAAADQGRGSTSLPEAGGATSSKAPAEEKKPSGKAPRVRATVPAEPGSFPSGRWQGYFMQFGKKFDLQMELTVVPSGKVTGTGTDSTGSFTVDGECNPSTGRFNFLQTYERHSIEYQCGWQGGAKQTVKGLWFISSPSGTYDSGELELWPARSESAP